MIGFGSLSLQVIFSDPSLSFNICSLLLLDLFIAEIQRRIGL